LKGVIKMMHCPACKSDSIEKNSSIGLRVIACIILLFIPYGIFLCWIPFIIPYTFTCKVCGYSANENELISIDWREKEKLEKLLTGIKYMEKLPDALFIIDPKREKIAVAEAKKLNIPIVAVVDTNCNPEEIDFVIPGNDDAIRAIKLMTSVIADAVMEGKKASIEDEKIAV